MKVFMVGGTGLLGSAAAAELIARGHEVSSIALPPLPEGAQLPPEMHIEWGNYLEMSDDELRAQLEGCEGFIFAAGVDERVEGPAPIYDTYDKYNIQPTRRLLGLARECGVKHAVICGSYFSHFAKTRPEMELTRWHPYIRSRIDQERVAMEYSADMDVAVLELPYIFGTQPGRKPVWVFLVEMIQQMPGATFYPGGGTTMVTVRQVAQAMAGALERNRGGRCYPIGWYNKSWREMLAVMHTYMGCGSKPIVTIPRWSFALAGIKLRADQRKAGIDGGLDLVKLADIMSSKFYIDMSEGALQLGVEPDDIDAAIGDSIRLSMAVASGQAQVVEMRGE